MSRSKLQENVGNILKKEFCYFPIVEEVHLGEGLMLDFLIRDSVGVNIGVEVQGEQHYSPNAFFHKDEEGWLNQQRNDKRKKELCASLNIALIEVKYDENLTRQLLFDKIYQALDEFECITDQPLSPYEIAKQ